jgi:hypothetical protein
VGLCECGVIRIHNKWMCCAAEWQNFREGDGSDRRAVFLFTGYWDAVCCLIVLWGRWALQGRAEPKIFLRGMIIRA